MTRHAMAARAAAVVVALVAGAASFSHIADVAMAAGERPWVAYSLPLAIDGLIVVGVAALLEDARAGRHGRWSARLAVLVGVVATLAANIASAEPTATARAVAVAAPVSFLLSVEVLTRSGRPRREVPADSGGQSAARPAESNTERRSAPRRGGGKRAPGDGAARVATAVTALGSDASVAALAREAGVSRSTVRRNLNGHNGQTIATAGS